jgi:hypothetical protein
MRCGSRKITSPKEHNNAARRTIGTEQVFK